MNTARSDPFSQEHDVVRRLELSFSRLRRQVSCGSEVLRLIVGYSTGLDSHVLLHALARCKDRLNLELIACYINHGLRPESAEEEVLAVRTAKDCGVPAVVKRAELRPVGANLEAWAREVRYRLLEEVRMECGAHWIVTAHHQLDQAETLLFRLLTGRLARSAQTISYIDDQRQVFRPLLNTSKTSIVHYADTFRLQYSHDASNFDCARTRNLIRLRLFPELERLVNPCLAPALGAAAGRLNDDENFLWEQSRAAVENGGGSTLRTLISQQHPALQWRIACLFAVRQVGEIALGLGYGKLVRVCRLCLEPPRGRRVLQLGCALECVVDSCGEAAFRRIQGALPRSTNCRPVMLAVPGTAVLHAAGRAPLFFRAEARTLTLEEFETLPLRAARCGESWRLPAEAYFDAAALAGRELTIRTWRPGDHMKVFKRGTRKLKKLFQEKRVSPALRQAIPVLELGGEIIWVPGVARSVWAPVDEASLRAVVLYCGPSSGGD